MTSAPSGLDLIGDVQRRRTRVREREQVMTKRGRYGDGTLDERGPDIWR